MPSDWKPKVKRSLPKIYNSNIRPPDTPILSHGLHKNGGSTIIFVWIASLLLKQNICWWIFMGSFYTNAAHYEETRVGVQNSLPPNSSTALYLYCLLRRWHKSTRKSGYIAHCLVIPYLPSCFPVLFLLVTKFWWWDQQLKEFGWQGRKSCIWSRRGPLKWAQKYKEQKGLLHEHCWQFTVLSIYLWDL